MPSSKQHRLAPRALIPTGFGINCEAETAQAFKLAGAMVDQIHLNDLAQQPARLAQAKILALAGGFSFGDHLGSGRVLAHRLIRRLGQALRQFIADGGLVIGICNGFQVMTRLGLVPHGALGQQTVTLATNQHGAFYDGWVTLAMDPRSPCIFTRGLTQLEVPVRHGEGRLMCSASVLDKIQQNHLAPVHYLDPQTGQPTSNFPHNPNGSLAAIAGLCDATGRIFGLMPHPEAFLYAENHPHQRRRSRTPVHENDHGDGLLIFRNAVDFKE